MELHLSAISKNLLFLLLVISAAMAKAQKLPNVQQNSVRAPYNIKIDGKATEWEFRAHN